MFDSPLLAKLMLNSNYVKLSFTIYANVISLINYKFCNHPFILCIDFPEAKIFQCPHLTEEQRFIIAFNFKTSFSPTQKLNSFYTFPQKFIFLREHQVATFGNLKLMYTVKYLIIEIKEIWRRCLEMKAFLCLKLKDCNFGFRCVESIFDHDNDLTE